MKTPLARVLIIDDDEQVRNAVSRVLRLDGYDVLTAEDGRAGLDIIESDTIDVALVDMYMPRMRGIEVLRRVPEASPNTVCIIVTGDGDITLANQCLELGAFDYLEKPCLNNAHFEQKLRRAAEVARLRREHSSVFHDDPAERMLIGNSAAIVGVRRRIRQVAGSGAAIHIQGESGTGKELVARAIHEMSGRSGQMLAQNCGAFSEGLIEDALFGHVTGSFSGANRNYEGLFGAAGEGTLLLDEIGDMAFELQGKLLRVVEERTYKPVGSQQELPMRARILSATLHDLDALVAQGRFREDLLYRLNVVTIRLPPLRERREDIRPLALRFVHELNKLERREVRFVAPDAMNLLEQADWPGNVRQLRHEIHRAVLLADGDTISADNILEGARPAEGPPPAPLTDDELLSLSWSEAKDRVIERFAHTYLRHHLERTSTITEAAQSAGMQRPNFSRLLKKFGVDNPAPNK
ncbi:MAG: sigma-54 dependent transcriptional regulator [Myxococcota bacterium]